MKAYTFILLVLTSLFTGCTELKSEYIPGNPMTIEDDELAEETIWQFNGDMYYVHSISSNRAVAATLNWKKGTNQYEAISYEVVLSELGDHLFLNALGKDNLYTIFRAVPAIDTPDVPTFTLFALANDFIKEEMKQGRVKAVEGKSEITLKGTKKEQDEFILKNINALFPPEQIAVVRQVIIKDEK